MADTFFTALNTTIRAVWLNVVNALAYYGRRPNFAVTTGSANAQVLTLETGSLYSAGSEADGDLFMFKAGFSNSGAMTLQVLQPAGTNVARAVQFAGAALVGGEVIAGQNYAVTRLGTTWQLLNFTPNAYMLTLLAASSAPTARSVLGVADATLTVDRFSGDGATTVFTLSADPGSENNTQVYISGVYQQKDQYSVTGTSLTFSSAPPTGTDNIEVVLGRTASIGTPGDATVNTAQLVDGAVTPLKLANAAIAPILLNGQIVASVAGNALTLALKTRAGTDPSSSDKVYAVFKSSTASSGALSVRSITGALSITISSGSTLGHVSNILQHLFVYLIDNAGTVEMAVSNLPPDYPDTFADVRLISTTTEGGGGAADSATTIYSTTARSNVPWLCIAMCKSTQTVAGTWAAVPSQIDMAPFIMPNCAFAVRRGSNQSINSATQTKVQFNTEIFDRGGVFDAATNFRFQPNVAGDYRLSASIGWSSMTAGSQLVVYIYKNGTPIQTTYTINAASGPLDGMAVATLVTANGTTDEFAIHVYQDSGGAKDVVATGGGGEFPTHFSGERAK